jgi:FKBP-type peptidyl-prolyl cis-trans isomerase 2
MGSLLLAAIAASLFMSGCAGERMRPVSAMEKEATRPDSATKFDAPRKDTAKDEASTVGMANAPGRAEKGDLARVNYTVTLDDGSLVSTTLPAVAENKKTVRSGWADLPGELAPVEVLAGEMGTVPGLGEAVVGMAAGERKRIELAPEKAYGARDERKVNRQPRESTIPKTIRLPAKEYVERVNAFPVVGREVPLVPYVTARVGEVTEADARLDVSAQEGARFDESFGTVDVHVAPDAITLRLTPQLGASFNVQGEQGRVVAVDNDSYTVDFNHPLAGKKINVDLEMVSLTRADTFTAMSLDWLEDHDRGLAAAKQAGKPAVLVLYAEWCQWCRKTFAETLQDPRVKELKESFVWVKVNSNQQKQYMEKYGQSGFPMIVLLYPDGTVARKIEGFRDGAALAGELRAFLAASGQKHNG